MQQDPATDNQPSCYEWVFIFVIYADHTTAREKKVTDPATDRPAAIGETRRWVNHLYNSLLKLNINDKHKIVIIHNQITSEEDVTFLQELVPGKRKPVLIKKVTEKYLLQKPRCLAMYLELLVSGIKIKKHCVVFCDHGSIFGINKVEIKGVSSNGASRCNTPRSYDIYYDQAEIEQEIVKQKKLNPDDTTSFEVLTVREVSAALANGLKKKVELMVMFNCNMVNLMTLYGIKDTVGILLGAASTMNYPGYNFKFVLNKLFDNSEPVPARELAELFLTSFTINNDMYNCESSRRTFNDCKNEIDSWTIAAVEPDSLDDEFTEQFNILCALLANNILALAGMLRKVFMKLYPFDINSGVTANLFDFYGFVHALSKQLEGGTSESDYGQLKRQLRYFMDPGTKLVHSLFLGKKCFQTIHHDYDDTLQNASGLGVFVPQSRYHIPARMDNFSYLTQNQLPDFFEQTKWKDFCDAYRGLM